MKTKYFIKIVSLSAIIGILTYAFFSFLFKEYYLDIMPFIILFFTIIAIGFHLMILKISKNNMSKFTSYFMLSSTLKLLTYIIFIIIYLLLQKENAIPFIVYFFILYIIYTAFEVIIVIPEIKKVK